MSGELFVELLHEELPASMIRPALEGLKDGLIGLLQGIEHGAVRTFSTPRRLAVVIGDVAPGRPLTERVVMGPPADRAFFQDGTPTDVGKGFARGKGIDPSDLRIVDGPKGKVVGALIQEGGEKTVDLIAKGLEGVVLGLPFAKSMEWGAGGIRWGRPLHRVNALYAGAVVAAKVGPLATGNASLGHRLAPDTDFRFTDSAEWLLQLHGRFVEPAHETRKERIRVLLADAATQLGADPIVEEALLDEVTNLVEWPVPVLGEFDAGLMHLPPRLLVQSMKQNQRYFPVHRKGELTNRFVAISNNPWGDEALVARGNAQVLKARFFDAKFFFAEDKKVPLEEHGKKLDRMQWIRGIGSMADKQARVSALARDLAGLTDADPDDAARAGALCKSDLTTLMVNEFPELQGHVGKLYALAGDPPEKAVVAEAIEESWQPRFAGDAPPKTAAGAAVALADRLDTLVGCFGTGITPTGGGDPQGLRRAAAGILAIIEARGLSVDLLGLLERPYPHLQANALAAPDRFGKWTAARKGSSDGSALATEVQQFVLDRLVAQAVADGASADVVQAVLVQPPTEGLHSTDPAAPGTARPTVIQAKLRALKALAGTPEFGPILQTFKRVLNITKGHHFPVPAEKTLKEPAERDLAKATAVARAQVATAAAALDYERALAVVTGLQAPVAAFFDAVLVDDPKPEVRARRMGLLLDVASVFLVVADFSRISTR